MTKLDRVNLRLLDLLQEDARHSYVDLADNLDRAETTVRERMGRLEEDGVLLGYRAEIDHGKVGFPVKATLSAEGKRERWPEIARRLRSVPYVTEAFLTTDQLPLRVVIRASDVVQVDEIITHELGGLGLGRMDVSIALRRMVPPRTLPLEQLHEEPRLPQERSDALGLGPAKDATLPRGRGPGRRKGTR